MDRTQEAKSFQPRPFAAKMPAKPYIPIVGRPLPLGNILNIMSDTRHKQRIPNRSLISHRNALVRRMMMSALALFKSLLLRS